MNRLGENQKLYKDILKCFNRYSTIINRTSKVENYQLSGLDFQVMECLLNNNVDQLIMSELSSSLGIATSTFTKIIAKLAQYGLVEKFHKGGNKKNIIVLLSNKGKELFSNLPSQTESWIEELDSAIQENPERVQYYSELLNFFINWMETGEEILDEQDQLTLIK